MLSPIAQKGRRTLLVLLVVVIAFIAGMFFYVQHQAQQISSEKTQVALAAHSQQIGELAAPEMFSYYDEDYGFEIKYPVGYAAELDPDVGVRLQFTANNPFSSYDKLLSAEVIQVGVNQGLSLRDLAENSFEGVENYSISPNSLGGKTVLLGRGETSGFVEESERIFLRAGFFECAKPDGTSYSAVIMAAVPESLQLDLPAVDYIISSFNC